MGAWPTDELFDVYRQLAPEPIKQCRKFLFMAPLAARRPPSLPQHRPLRAPGAPPTSQHVLLPHFSGEAPTPAHPPPPHRPTAPPPHHELPDLPMHHLTTPFLVSRSPSTY